MCLAEWYEVLYSGLMSHIISSSIMRMMLDQVSGVTCREYGCRHLKKKTIGKWQMLIALITPSSQGQQPQKNVSECSG